MINVLDYGALGNGQDDTAALQSALDSTDSHIFFPEDHIFTVDPAVGLRIGSGKVLHHPRLMIQGNKAPRTRALETIPDSRDIRILGGEIIGSRLNLTGLQWGIGLRIDGATNVTVEGTKFSEWFFDGVWVGGNYPSRNVVLRGVVCSENRRNGLSIVNADGVGLYDCVFEKTQGQDPQSGCDVEPNPLERVTNLTIVNCKFSDNTGMGLYMHKGRGVGGANYTLLNSTFSGNVNYNLVGNTIDGLRVVGCTISGGGKGASFGAETKNLTFCDNQILPGLGNSLILAAVENPKIYGNELNGGKVAIIAVGARNGVYGKVYGEI